MSKRNKQFDDSKRPLLNQEALENGTIPLESAKKSIQSKSRFQRLYISIKDEMQQNNFWRVVVGEFYGMAMLNYMVQTIVYTSVEYVADPFVRLSTMAFLHVVFFCILYLIFQPISGCLVNPAVTLNFIIIGRVHWFRGVLIIIMEFLGCLVGSSLVLFGFADERRKPMLLGCTSLPDKQSIQNGLIGEIAGSFILNLAVLGHLDPETGVTTKIGAVTIGATIGFLVETIAPISSASLNPFRTLGPAITLNYYQDIWIYMVGPVVGAVLAGLAYTNFLKDRRNVDRWYKLSASSQNDVISYFSKGTYVPSGILSTDKLQVKKWVSIQEDMTSVPVKDMQVVVVEFFAADNAVSKMSCQYLNKVYKSFKHSIFILGISLDGRPPTEAFIKKYGPEYTVGEDQDGDLNLEFLNQVTTDFLPITVVLNYGNVVWLGSSTNPELVEAIKQALNSSENGQGGSSFQIRDTQE